LFNPKEETRMRRSKTLALAVAFVALAALGAACANKSTTGGSSPTGANDLLAKIKASGKIAIATDPAYPPQSSFDEATNTWKGFDIDVANEIAKRLGVTVVWKTPSWDLITAGSWHDRWDLSVGSMTITAPRAQVLRFSVPYYYTPAGLAVPTNSSVTSLDQLAGKTVGSCGACSYQDYLEQKLQIPGYTPTYLVPSNVTIKTYDTDSTMIQDLALGRLDAGMSAIPTLQGAIDNGTKIKLLGDPVFWEPLAVAADRSSSLDSTSLIAAVSAIISQMHADGTLKTLSEKWYHEDLTTAPTAAGSASPTA
jgi:polar amino acid transport system substrate-binding protein